MLLLERLQLHPGAFGQRGDPSAELLRDVVTGRGLRRVDQRGQPRDLFRVAVVAQNPRVGDLGLSGEVRQFRRGDPSTQAAASPRLSTQCR